MTYRFGLLQPSRVANAEATNAAWLGPRTLGIEVTEPALASRCGLGNLDPQHGPAGEPARAAIAAALTLPLPPVGAKLVTIRPDADAIGAMAVLTLRAAQTSIGPGLPARVARVAAADGFLYGPWPGALQAVHESDAIYRRLLPDLELASLGALLARSREDLTAGVALMEGWLCADDDSVSAAKIVAAVGPVAERIEREVRAVAADAAGGGVLVRGFASGRMAVVETLSAFGVRLGYTKAPVVLAVNPALAMGTAPVYRKVTVAQWAAGHVALDLVCRELSHLEPGWGGTSTIIGSPQGIDCRLTIELIAGIVERHLMASAFSPASDKAPAVADCMRHRYPAMVSPVMQRANAVQGGRVEQVDGARQEAVCAGSESAGGEAR